MPMIYTSCCKKVRPWEIEYLYFRQHVVECMRRDSLASLCHILLVYAKVQLVVPARQVLAKFVERLSADRIGSRGILKLDVRQP